MDVFSGSNDQCDDPTKFGPPIYYFGNHTEFYRMGTGPNDEHDDSIVGEYPVLFFQVNLTKSKGTASVLGYGFVDIPMNPGNYDIDISTSKPVAGKNMGEIEYRMNDYYFGCSTKEFQYMKTALNAPLLKPKTDNKLTVASRNGIVTEGSGSVRIRIRVLSLPEGRNHRDTYQNHTNLTRPIFHETISEVLSRVRRNKRERLIRDKLNPDVTENSARFMNGNRIARTDGHYTDAKKCEQNSRTDAILRRVKARKITRMSK